MSNVLTPHHKGVARLNLALAPRAILAVTVAVFSISLSISAPLLAQHIALDYCALRQEALTWPKVDEREAVLQVEKRLHQVEGRDASPLFIIIDNFGANDRKTSVDILFDLSGTNCSLSRRTDQRQIRRLFPYSNPGKLVAAVRYRLLSNGLGPPVTGTTLIFSDDDTLLLKRLTALNLQSLTKLREESPIRRFIESFFADGEASWITQESNRRNYKLVTGINSHLEPAVVYLCFPDYRGPVPEVELDASEEQALVQIKDVLNFDSFPATLRMEIDLLGIRRGTREEVESILSELRLRVRKDDDFYSDAELEDLDFRNYPAVEALSQVKAEAVSPDSGFSLSLVFRGEKFAFVNPEAMVMTREIAIGPGVESLSLPPPIKVHIVRRAGTGLGLIGSHIDLESEGLFRHVIRWSGPDVDRDLARKLELDDNVFVDPASVVESKERGGLLWRRARAFRESEQARRISEVNATLYQLLIALKMLGLRYRDVEVMLGISESAGGKTDLIHKRRYVTEYLRYWSRSWGAPRLKVREVVLLGKSERSDLIEVTVVPETAPFRNDLLAPWLDSEFTGSLSH